MRLPSFHEWPALLVPLDAVDEERSAVGPAAALDVAMVEAVFLAVLCCEHRAAMTGTVEAVALVAVQHGSGKAFGHAVAVAVEEVVGELLCPTHLQLIGVVAEEA